MRQTPPLRDPSGSGPFILTLCELAAPVAIRPPQSPQLKPFTFFMSNDAFYFGVLPVLAETASRYGIEPVEMARASITGQTFHMQSPLVPAILLLVTLAGVPLADHHKKVLWRAALVSLSMLAIGVVFGQIPL